MKRREAEFLHASPQGTAPLRCPYRGGMLVCVGDHEVSMMPRK